MVRDNIRLSKLGKVDDNYFKESVSVIYATEAFEKSRKIKTYFTKQDKRPNLDGSLSVVENQEEIITVEVQIKTLPKDYTYKKVKDYKYHYCCDIKVFSVVLRKTTLNPVALILVDDEKKKVYVKILTEKYVQSLGIENQNTKVIQFSDEDILDVDRFIDEVKKYRDQKSISYSADVPMIVDSGVISKILRKKRRLYDKYSLVYIRNNIRGYLSDYIYYKKSDYREIILKVTDGIAKDESFKTVNPQYHEDCDVEFISILVTSKMIIVNRSILRTTATDQDVINVLYDVACILKTKLLYYSAGVPMYLVEGEMGGFKSPLFKICCEEIKKEW